MEIATTGSSQPLSLAQGFALKLERLREVNLESKEAAAIRCGVSIRQYHRWCDGGATPRRSNIRKVAAAYDVDPSFFSNGAVEDPAPFMVPATNGELEALYDLLETLTGRVEQLERRRWWHGRRK